MTKPMEELGQKQEAVQGMATAQGLAEAAAGPILRKLAEKIATLVVMRRLDLARAKRTSSLMKTAPLRLSSNS